MKLNKLILPLAEKIKILLLLPVVPISKSLISLAPWQKRLRLYYLLFIFIGILSSIIFRFNLMLDFNNSNLFIILKYIITIFAGTFLFYVITMTIKRIMFFNTYYLQVKEGVRHNKRTYNVKLLFIFKVLICTFLSILYTYNFILILRNTNYLTGPGPLREA